MSDSPCCVNTKSETEEGLSHETNSTSCLGPHCDGKENVAAAARRRRRTLQRGILYKEVLK